MKKFIENSFTGAVSSVRYTIIPSKRSTARQPEWNNMDQLIMNALLRIKLTDISNSKLDNCLTSNNFMHYLEGSTKAQKVKGQTPLESDQKQKLVKIFSIVQSPHSELVINEERRLSELKSWFQVKHKLSELISSHSAVPGTDPPTAFTSFITNSEDQPSLSATLEGMNTSAAQTTPNCLNTERQVPDIFNNGDSLFTPASIVPLLRIQCDERLFTAEVGFTSSQPSTPSSPPYNPVQSPTHNHNKEEVANLKPGSIDTDDNSVHSEKSSVTRGEARRQSASSSASATGNSPQNQSESSTMPTRRDSFSHIKPDTVRDVIRKFQEPS